MVAHAFKLLLWDCCILWLIIACTCVDKGIKYQTFIGLEHVGHLMKHVVKFSYL